MNTWTNKEEYYETQVHSVYDMTTQLAYKDKDMITKNKSRNIIRGMLPFFYVFWFELLIYSA